MWPGVDKPPPFYHETTAWPSSSDAGPGASQQAWRWMETEPRSGDSLRGVDVWQWLLHLRRRRLSRRRRRHTPTLGSESLAAMAPGGALAGTGAGACQWPGPGLISAVEDSDDSDGPDGPEWAKYWAKEALPGSPSRVP
jgi:hypothetical protein